MYNFCINMILMQANVVPFLYTPCLEKNTRIAQTVRMEDVNMNNYTLNFLKIYSLMFLLAAFTTSGYAGEKGRNNLPTITEIADTTDGFSVLSAALEATGLDEALDGKKQYTVFAPTDDAFKELLKDQGLTPEQLLNQPELVAAVLKFHVTRGNRYASSVIGAGALKMLDRNITSISVTAEGAMIEDAVIKSPDLRARNGVIHIIDKVIIPPGTL